MNRILAPFIALILIAAITFGFLRYVSLTPNVNANFFFGSNSELFEQHEEIGKDYPASSQLIIKTFGSNIKDYEQNMQHLSDKLEAEPEIKGVFSPTHGPENLDDARNGALWKRLFWPEDTLNIDQPSYIILSLDEKDAPSLIAKLEKMKDVYAISGVPYIILKIKDYLKADLTNFLSLCFGLIALMVLIIYRNIWIMFSIIAVVASGAMSGLLSASLFGVQTAILTGNILTITAIITLSHLIFFTNNWRKSGTIGQSFSMTFPASFWCMVTTLLGFCSLLLVDAKPLRELGAGGAFGTVAAFLVVYLFYPLLLSVLKSRGSDFHVTEKRAHYSYATYGVAFVIFIVTLFCGYGVLKINTDPSLLDYFDDESGLYKGLNAIDEDGGSSPLTFVIERTDEEFLDSDESYQRMLKLQDALEANPETGVILSLPVLMAQAKSYDKAKDVPWEAIFTVLSSDKMGNIGDSFVDLFRTQAVFMIRMKEQGRAADRPTVIKDLQNIITKHGFTVKLTGGPYALQSILSRDVGASILQGLLYLLGIFAVLALLISWRISITIAITLTIASIIAILLGATGWLGMPLDIISAPSINVCIGIAIDSLIHITLAAKRFGKGRISINSMMAAIVEQRTACFASAITICAGFLVFMLSNFPPTIKFGLIIAIGIIVTFILVMILFPVISKLLLKKQ